MHRSNKKKKKTNALRKETIKTKINFENKVMIKT